LVRSGDLDGEIVRVDQIGIPVARAGGFDLRAEPLGAVGRALSLGQPRGLLRLSQFVIDRRAHPHLGGQA